MASQAHQSQDSSSPTERSGSWLKSSVFLPYRCQGSGVRGRGTGLREKRNSPTQISWERQRPQQVPSCFTRVGTGPARRNEAPAHERVQGPQCASPRQRSSSQGKDGEGHPAARSSDHRESRIGCYFLGPHFQKVMKKLKGPREQGFLANEGLKSKCKGQKDSFQFNRSPALSHKRRISLNMSEAG